MSDTAHAAVGRVVDRYVIEELLGQGGVGVVYRVRHRQLGTLHALKVLHPGADGMRRRFELEGLVQARLRHPNIVAVSDVLELDGMPALLMEYVAGPTLEHLAMTRRLGLEEIDGIAEGVFAGVEAIHRHGLVHRDLKPANILLQPTPQGFLPKVTDFGLAKVLDRARDDGRTQVNAIMGTPGYMPPEQIRDVANVGPAADVFALGAILYELVGGRSAFRRDNVFDTFKAVDSGDYTPLGQLRAEAPERVLRAVVRALRTDPDERPPSVEALRSLWRGGGVAPTVVGPVPVALTEGEAEAIRERSPQARDTFLVTWAHATAVPDVAPGSGRAGRWLAAGAVATLLIAGLGWTVLRDQGRPAPAAPPLAPTQSASRAADVTTAAEAAGPAPAAPNPPEPSVEDAPPSEAAAPEPVATRISSPPPQPVEAAHEVAVPREVIEQPGESPEAALADASPEPRASEATEEPAEAPPPTTATVIIDGDPTGIWLRSPAGTFPPGEVAPGRYTVSIVGISLDPFDAGTIDLAAGERAVVRCDRLEGHCERIP